MLISFIVNDLNAQVIPSDTLKKVSADTLIAPEDEEGGIDEQINYTAEDSTVGLPSLGKVYLYGTAKVDYGSLNMQADVIEIDYVQNVVLAYGRKDSTGKNIGTPIFRDGNDAPIEAEKIMYNLKSKRGKIFSALTKQGELLVVGDEIKKDSTDIIYMKDMKCIPCEDTDARTVFKASRAKIIPDDKIVTGPVFLQIGGVPTPLGLPFGFFPNSKKQMDGLLMPNFGNSAQQGFFLKDGGYYLGFNDQTDMEIRADVYSNGSYRLHTRNNYHLLYKSRGTVGLSYSNFNFGDKDVPSSYQKQIAQEITWQHTQDNKSNPNIRFTANVNYRTNQLFNRFNSENSQQFVQNNFLSNVNFTRSYKFGSLSISALHNQNAQTREMNITLPNLVFNVNRFFPFRNENRVKQNVIDKIGMHYVLDVNNTLSGNDTSIFKGNLADSLQYGFKHTLPISTNFNIFKYITATPAVNLTSVMYDKTIDKKYYARGVYFDMPRDTTVVSNVKGFKAGYDANFSTALATQVYFDYHFHKTKIKQIRHLLIPTINYLYRPDYGEAHYGFWKDVRFDSTERTRKYSIFERTVYGGPAEGEQNGIGISLNNNLEAKVKQRTDTGITFKKVVLLQNLSVSSAYNFAADSFNMQPVGLSARTKLFRYFDVVANASLDPYAYDNTTNRRLTTFNYSHNAPLFRLTRTSLAVNTTIGSDMIAAQKRIREAPKISSGAERGVESELDHSTKLPWNLNVYYTLDLVNENAWRLQPNHNLQFSGEIMPTKFWKMGISSGFNFETATVEMTRFSITRDLKCWQAKIDWVPFGINRQYTIVINLKSSMFSELKLQRNRPWVDNFR